MTLDVVNWLAVVVCVVVSMISGFLWYHPKTFFPAWWKGINKMDTPAPTTGGPPSTWVLTVLAAVVQAVVMSVVLSAMGAGNVSAGVTAGVLLWFGFVAPTSLANKLFAGAGMKVWAIEAGNHLLNFVLFGAILGFWR